MKTNIWGDEVLDSKDSNDEESVLSKDVLENVMENSASPEPQASNQNESSSITINGTIITAGDILKRQSNIRKSIPENEYKKLTSEEKLIIDLPIMMVRLGWLYSAYCQIHWLEADGFEVEVPYDFVSSYPRVNKEFKKVLNNFSQMQYASIEEYTNLVRSSFDGSATNLLYDFDVSATQEAYYKAISYLKSIADFGEHSFGNFNLSEPPPKMNLVRSYKLGGFAGDMDDLGGSFGRFSLRIYVKGMVQDQDFNDLQFRKFHLNISEIGFRYIDEFSFNDNQDLGYWKHDINNPETPARFSITSSSGSIELKNSDYRRLRNRGLGLGRDFMLLTAPRYMSSKEGLKVKPNIIFFFKK